MPELPPIAIPGIAGDAADSRPSTQTPEPAPAASTAAAHEIGGPPGPEPTRYGDWERNGRCIDF
ncbi:MAG: DUF1674 domain-containing protein [Gammaproteobacteria bacterium]|nr:DUF1674 domain-containing protein [Gammaproteobacteria bacterium]